MFSNRQSMARILAERFSWTFLHCSQLLVPSTDILNEKIQNLVTNQLLMWPSKNRETFNICVVTVRVTLVAGNKDYKSPVTSQLSMDHPLNQDHVFPVFTVALGS